MEDYAAPNHTNWVEVADTLLNLSQIIKIAPVNVVNNLDTDEYWITPTNGPTFTLKLTPSEWDLIRDRVL